MESNDKIEVYDELSGWRSEIVDRAKEYCRSLDGTDYDQAKLEDVEDTADNLRRTVSGLLAVLVYNGTISETVAEQLADRIWYW